MDIIKNKHKKEQPRLTTVEIKEVLDTHRGGTVKMELPVRRKRKEEISGFGKCRHAAS